MVSLAHAPIFELFGAYFPVWLPAMLAGVIGASVLRGILGRTRLHERLPLPLTTYVCSIALFACLTWLLLT